MNVLVRSSSNGDGGEQILGRKPQSCVDEARTTQLAENSLDRWHALIVRPNDMLSTSKLASQTHKHAQFHFCKRQNQQSTIARNTPESLNNRNQSCSLLGLCG
jgi:hypothetical protein